MTQIENEVVGAFRSKIRGSVLLPGDSGFDDARRLWNAMIDRKPAMIVRCLGVADVMHSVRLAHELDLVVAVRGGGHNIAGNAVCDGGLMIDLSSMKSIRVNPGTRRAYAEPGVTLGEFDHETQAFGLVTPLGINSTTGIAGLTLGGGFGWLSRKFGMTVDNLVSVDVVTADGKLVRASEHENSDLFWAVRGGGGNFGIATLFEFQLHPVGPDIFCGLIVFPFEQAREVLINYRRQVEKMPDEMSVWVVLRHAPPLPFLPEEVHGKKIIALAVFYAGEADVGMEAAELLRSVGKPYGEHLGVQPYTVWQQAFDPLLTPGARNYWKSHNFSSLGDEVFDIIIEYAERLPSPQSEIFIGLLGGETCRIEPTATAYAHRDTQFVLNVHARWEEMIDDDRCIFWARDFFNASAPHSTGSVYVNFMTEEEVERITAAYGPGHKLLVQIKNKYDPGNFFRLNQNIKPSI